METEHGHNTGHQHQMNSNAVLGHFNPNGMEKSSYNKT